jgi:hypothetical protein
MLRISSHIKIEGPTDENIFIGRTIASRICELIVKRLNQDLTCPIYLDLYVIANKPAIGSDFKSATISCNECVINTNILIDTGALQSNYVDKTVAMRLKGSGAIKERNDTMVCSGVCGLCAKTSKVIYFNLTMLNGCNDNYLLFQLKLSQ